jgi:hypothetical protein
MTDPKANFGGDVAGAVEAVRMLLGHPNLLQMRFRDDGLVDLDTFVEKVMQGKEEQKNLVSIRKGRGCYRPAF